MRVEQITPPPNKNTKKEPKINHEEIFENKTRASHRHSENRFIRNYYDKIEFTFSTNKNFEEA